MEKLEPELQEVKADVKLIPLTQGRFAMVDKKDFILLNKWKWFAEKRSGTFYAARNRRQKEGKRGLIRMHQQIMSPPRGKNVDHISGDGLDCRRANLRICTLGQNVANKTRSKHAALGTKGVYWSKTNNRWVVQISLRNKTYHVGSFLDRRFAALIYNKAAQIAYGRFASLNYL